MNIYDQIIKLLDKHEVVYETFEHEPVITSEQAAAVRGNDLAMGAKAMIMRSKGKFYQAVISGEKKIDMNKLKGILKTKSLSFASPEEVKHLTGCDVGGVPPFGNLFNIPVYLDKHILQQKIIDFNAGLRTHSIEMPLKDYLAIVNPHQVDFAKE